MRDNVILGSLITLGLVFAGCSPAATPLPQPTKPAAQEPPAPARAAPTPTPRQGDQPRYGGVLTVSTADDPLTMDILQEVSFLTQNVYQSAYNGITKYDPGNPEEIIPDLAKSWEISKDGLTYSFGLHENVKFHDGAPLTSEDIKFSFERQINPPRGVLAPRRSDLAALSRVETPDKLTANLIVKYPTGAFLDVISSGLMVVYSKAFVEKKGDMKKDVMGTGPFKFKRQAMGSTVEHVKNPDYFIKGRPYLDGVVFYVVKDAATRFAALRTGQVKLTGPGTSGLRPSEADLLRNTSPQMVIVSYPGFSHGNFIMNTQEKPWTDARVRKAVHLTIDRQTAVKVLAEDYGYVGSYMPGKWGVPQEELLKMPGFRQPKDADIAEAKRLLAEAGYPEGFTQKSLVRSGRKYENVGIFLVDQLAKVGIKLELDIKESAVRTKLLNEGAFNNHPGTSSLNFGDPENVARYWAKPLRDDWGNNWQRYSDDKVWDLFDKQSRALDPNERKKVVRELDLLLIESAARPIIYWENAILAHWPEVKNRGKLYGNYNFQQYQDVWLAK
ncbi:MAG: ABC transporter substrate-binding protein [Chloroflexi bacterium]|nr:ABC transporter substrate-binding protein [Chloroflexota bacterium]